MFHQTKLPNGHAAISWLAADARRVMVYREVGARGPDDHGAIIASRDLPVDATADDVACTIAKLAEPLPDRVLLQWSTDTMDAFGNELYNFSTNKGDLLYFTADALLPALRAAYVPGDWTWPDRVVVRDQTVYSYP